MNFFGTPAASSSTNNGEATWASWMESTSQAAKEMASDLAQKAQEETVKFGEVALAKTTEASVQLSRQVQEVRQNYNNDVSNSLLQGFGLPKEERKLDMVHVTENVINMAFPYDRASLLKGAKGNDINAVSAYLNTEHKGHYMIWNISEDSYNYSLFGDQVLGMLMNLFLDIVLLD